MLIFFCSRNNYLVLEEWLKQNKYSNSECTIVNFDVGSSESSIRDGKRLCSLHNVLFECADNPAIQACFKRAVEIAESKAIDWVVYQQQDTWAITPDFYSLLDCRLNNLGYKDNVGFVGVNIYHDDDDISLIDGTNKWMTPARCFLQKGDGWYRRKRGSRTDLDLYLQRDFVSESIFWVVGACHVKSFEAIEVDSRFDFILGFDDMIYQMLLKNKYQIVLAGLDVAHDQSMKEGTGIQKKSTVASALMVKKFYGRVDYAEVWKSKYGFEFNFQKKIYSFKFDLLGRIFSRLNRLCFPAVFSNLESRLRYQYRNNENVIKSNLTEKFYNHDPKKGPLMYLEDLC